MTDNFTLHSLKIPSETTNHGTLRIREAVIDLFRKVLETDFDMGPPKQPANEHSPSRYPSKGLRRRFKQEGVHSDGSKFSECDEFGDNDTEPPSHRTSQTARDVDYFCRFAFWLMHLTSVTAVGEGEDFLGDGVPQEESSGDSGDGHGEGNFSFSGIL